MKQEKYSYKTESNFEFFEFYSEGPKGIIKKVVEFQPTSKENIYNLAFGDYDESKNRIDDLAVSNNNDSFKVLATVASIVYAFAEKHPDVWIIATGSTKSRTRLYRMGITNNLVEIAKDFYLYGFNFKGEWVKFTIGEDYEAFLITKK